MTTNIAQIAGFWLAMYAGSTRLVSGKSVSPFRIMRLEPATAHGDHAGGALQAQISHLRVVAGMRFVCLAMEVA